MNNIYTDILSESLFSQQYEHKQKYTSKRKHVSKDKPKGVYDKARDKASRVKSDYRLVHGYREVRASKRNAEWEII